MTGPRGKSILPRYVKIKIFEKGRRQEWKEENNRKAKDVFYARVTLIDINTAAVEEKGALAAVYEPSELSDKAPRLYVVVCHASLVPQRRYETFTIRYVTPFALDILQIYHRCREYSRKGVEEDHLASNGDIPKLPSLYAFPN